MTNRTETCTPEERRFLDEALSQQPTCESRDGDPVCMYCSADLSYEGHDADCVWLAALAARGDKEWTMAEPKRPLKDVLVSARAALITARAKHDDFSTAADVIDRRRNELTQWISHLELGKTDYWYQPHDNRSVTQTTDQTNTSDAVEVVARAITRYTLDDADYTYRAIDHLTGEEFDVTDEGEIDRLNARAAIAAHLEALEAAGMVVVPAEPIKKMFDAGLNDLFQAYLGQLDDNRADLPKRQSSRPSRPARNLRRHDNRTA